MIVEIWAISLASAVLEVLESIPSSDPRFSQQIYYNKNLTSIAKEGKFWSNEWEYVTIHVWWHNQIMINFDYFRQLSLNGRIDWGWVISQHMERHETVLSTPWKKRSYKLQTEFHQRDSIHIFSISLLFRLFLLLISC